MKVWFGYGSEHSASLVILGTFKDVATAKEVIDILEDCQATAAQTSMQRDLNDADAMAAYHKHKIGDITLNDLEGITLDHHWVQEGKTVRITTDDTEIQAIMKILLSKEAKIQMYSSHSWTADGKPAQHD